ncbi:MAG: hypothetical protein AMXMBFR66_03520 [Pseudomonadota bacterium]|nr:LON peptidase substrate-binding domain-containing protein [Rubrivivax sp.]NLZ41232.1 peptidase S16 [Comamonadaceae bacterium]
MSRAAAPALPEPLALFPLRTVLFPGARLGLEVFEARYVDLAARCLRAHEPFGVVWLREGREAGGRAPVRFEPVGVLAHIDEVDADRPGILNLRCTGGLRFRLAGPAEQCDDGLWIGRAVPIAADPPQRPQAAMAPTVSALGEAIRKLEQQQRTPFAPPYRLDDAGWVANRWCELLPVPLAAKQKLMELDDPALRLAIVDGYLRDKKVVAD